MIIDLFVKGEMNGEISLLKEKDRDVIWSKVGSIFDCDMWVGIEVGKYKEGKDFLWGCSNGGRGDMNFVM